MIYAFSSQVIDFMLPAGHFKNRFKNCDTIFLFGPSVLSYLFSGVQILEHELQFLECYF